MHPALLVLLINSSSVSSAFNCSAPYRPPVGANRDVARFQKAGIVDDAERMTAEDFATSIGQTKQAVEQRYSASGDLNCNHRFGQGQVVLKGDVMISAAHVLYPPDFCKKKKSTVRLSDCKYTVRVDGQRLDYDIEGVADTGYKCPAPKGHNEKAENDWVVFKLKTPVDERIKPYSIDPRDVGRIYPGRGILVVAKSHDFNPTNAKMMVDAERHYGGCMVTDVSNDGPQGNYQTNCDVAPNASGGGVFNESPRIPNLLALVRAELKPTEGCSKEMIKDNAGPSQKGCWGTKVVPIAGNLKQAIDRAAGTKPSNSTGGPESPNPVPVLPSTNEGTDL